MDSVKEKLVELIRNAHKKCKAKKTCHECEKYGNGSDCVYLFIAEDLIAHGVTVQEWISVKDRLPDSGKYVLAYCSDGLYGEGHYRAYENKWYLSKITYKSIPDVTHWMPLPKPPKGE